MEEIRDMVREEVRAALFSQDYGVEKVEYHAHTGVDSPRVSYFNLADRRLWLMPTLVGTQMATAGNYGVVFIAPVTCVLTRVQAVFETASTSGTLTIEKLTGTTAVGSGTDMLMTTMSLAGTANTTVTGMLSATPSTLQLAIGDRLALRDGGTLTNGVGLCVSIELSL